MKQLYSIILAIYFPSQFLAQMDADRPNNNTQTTFVFQDTLFISRELSSDNYLAFYILPLDNWKVNTAMFDLKMNQLQLDRYTRLKQESGIEKFIEHDIPNHILGDYLPLYSYNDSLYAYLECNSQHHGMIQLANNEIIFWERDYPKPYPIKRFKSAILRDPMEIYYTEDIGGDESTTRLKIYQIDEKHGLIATQIGNQPYQYYIKTTFAHHFHLIRCHSSHAKIQPNPPFDTIKTIRYFYVK